VINQDVVRQFRVSEHVMESVAEEQRQELARRETAYRQGRPPVDVTGKTVILIDDGLATGSTMRAATLALRQLGPSAIIVAVPVGAAETCEYLRDSADRVICVETPKDFSAVGRWYVDFTQTTDEEVQTLLNRAAHERRLERVRDRGKKVALPFP
jgi:predicted phosphoribosyltransferase